MDFITKLKGYQRWGQVLAVIAKLRWFEDHHYLSGFCQNYNYNYEEISVFLKVAKSIIEGQSDLYENLKTQYNDIKTADDWSKNELVILDSLLV